MSKRVVRSTLMFPVNVPRFVDKAYLRDADAIMLDLEDAVPANEKDTARSLVKEAISKAGKGGALVSVRINNEPEWLMDDLVASIHPGLDTILLPKTETVEEIIRVDAFISLLEKQNGMQPGGVKILLIVETQAGVCNLRALAAAVPRVEAMSIGTDDYCLGLGVEPSRDGMEIFWALSELVAVAKANKVRPVGILGSIAGFGDLEGFEKSAVQAKKLGCEGALCIHPAQVEVLNRVFSPSAEKVEHARRVMETFEEGQKIGRASMKVDGWMIDWPIYLRAKMVFERSAAIEELEKKKADALAIVE